MEQAAILGKLNILLETFLQENSPNHPIKQAYHYAVLPAGKLFRPQLVCAIAADFGNENFTEWDKHTPHALLAAAVEIHHAYTLVHDDLPCMDNDDFRRGKPSTHKAFGEWQALLAGDGLLSMSYRLLAKIKSPNMPQLFNFFSWATGAKGLIHGQVLDLAEEMKRDFPTLIETHKLKTARLIQTSLCGSYVLLPNYSFKTFYQLYKLGHALGVAFQLLDDLTEMAEADLSAHEASIAPWLNYPQDAQVELELRLNQVRRFFEMNNCPLLKMVLSEYFGKILSIINRGEKHIECHLAKSLTPARLSPIVSLLQRIC